MFLFLLFLSVVLWYWRRVRYFARWDHIPGYKSTWRSVSTITFHSNLCNNYSYLSCKLSTHRPPLHPREGSYREIAREPPEIWRSISPRLRIHSDRLAVQLWRHHHGFEARFSSVQVCSHWLSEGIRKSLCLIHFTRIIFCHFPPLPFPSPFFIPQRANYEKGEFFQLPIWTRQVGFSAWGIQTGPFAAL